MSYYILSQYQDSEESVEVAPGRTEDPLLFDGRDEDAGKDAEREDQIAQRHAKHQPGYGHVKDQV